MGPPVAVQKLREDFYMVQVPLSETPSADWKRLFYDTQQAPPPDFLPRAVEMSGALLKFRSDGASFRADWGNSGVSPDFWNVEVLGDRHEV